MIDTVTFDLWNTLIVNAPPDMEKYRAIRVQKMEQLLRQNGRGVSFGRLLSAYTQGLEECKETWRRNLDLSTEEQLRIMFRFLDDENLTETLESLMPGLVEAYVSPILEDPPNPVDGAADSLNQVKRKGYKVGLICNTGTTPGRTIRVLLERMRLASYFDVTTFSDEFKIRKPDPRIFLHTLARLNSRPHTSAHVGDLIDADIWGAKNVGMVTVHYHPSRAMCDDIMPDLTVKNLSELVWVLADLKQT